MAASADDYPPFQLGKSRFDQSNFSGRLRHFLDVVDPRTLLTSQQRLQASVKLLEDYKEGKLPSGVTNKQLWEAQKIKQAILHPDTGQKILMPFRMSATASTLNAVLMRNSELREGVVVVDEAGQEVGTSVVAAHRAVRETAITRAFLPAPILLIPPVVMAALEKTRFLRQWPRLHLPVQVVVCTLSFGLALPVSIALFPQQAEIAVSDLEPEIRAKTNRTTLFYNKGL